MIRYLKHNEVDKKKWDNCLDHCVNNIIYSYSWYLDVVCPNWEALVENDYESVMPLTGNKKYGISYLYPPYFAQQLGVFSKEKTEPEKVEEFLNAIPSHYKFLEINLNTRNTFEFLGFQIKKNTNIELSLDSSYEVLRKKFSEDTRRNIKKALKYEVYLKKDISPSDVIRVFRKNTGKKITNLTSKNYKTLLKLIESCIEKKQAEVWGAFSKENKLCAGVVWLIKNNRAIFLFSATDQQAKKSGAMFFIIDKFIQEHAGQKMILDFEGSNLPGLARFYKGFGSEEYVYLQVKKNNLPKPIRWLKR
ncbi:MAG: hypothetical protein ACHQHP_01395 [Bacteroidia bacterium]